MNNISIVKSGKVFKVSFLDGDILSCNVEEAFELAEALSQDVYTIIPILTRIRNSGVVYRNTGRSGCCKVSIENLRKTLEALFNVFTNDEVLEILEELKFSEMLEVFSSDNPVLLLASL